MIRPAFRTPVVALAAAAGLLGPARPALAEGKGGPEAERFLNGMRRVRDEVQTARFELKGQILYTAQSRSGQVAGRYFPDRDEVGDVEHLILFDFVRNRFRDDYRGMEMFENQAGASAAAVRHITTYDGIQLYKQFPKKEGQNDRFFEGHARQWEMVKQPDKMLSAVFFTESFPVLFACGRLPHPRSNYKPGWNADVTADELEPRGEVAVGGHACFVLRWVRPPSTDGIYTEWFVDMADGFRVRKYQETVSWKVNYVLEIEYDGTSRVPASWAYRSFENDNPRRRGILGQEVIYRVQKAVFNQTEPDTAFQPDLAPKMLILTDDGLLQVGRDRKTLEPVGTTSRRPYYVGAAVVAVLLGLGAAAAYRWRRRHLPPVTEAA